MKVKVGFVYNSNEELNKLCEKPLPIATAFKLIRFIKNEVGPAVEAFEKKRMPILKEAYK